jgi:hypothetical protein
VAGEDTGAATWKSQNLCSMLICGWLNNALGGYYVGHDGQFQSLDTLGDFITTGTGGLFADAVYQTQRYFEKRLELSDEEVFQHTLMLTCLYANQCSLPFEVLRISLSGDVVHLRSKEPSGTLEEGPPASPEETSNNGA